MNSQGHIYAIYQIFDKIFEIFKEKAKTNPNASIDQETKEKILNTFAPYYDSGTTKSQQSERINNFVSKIRRDNRGNFIYKRVLRSKLQEAKVDNCKEILETLKPEEIKGIVFSEQKFIQTCQTLKDAKIIATIPQLTNLTLNGIKTEINKIFKGKNTEDLITQISNISDDEILKLIDEENSSDDVTDYDDTERAEIIAEIIKKKKEELCKYVRGLLAWNGKTEILESKSFKSIKKDDQYNDNIKKKLLESCVLVLKTKEECEVRLRLREMQYLYFLEQIGVKDKDSDKYHLLFRTINKHVFTENEVVESFNNLKDCFEKLPPIPTPPDLTPIEEFSDPSLSIEDCIAKGLDEVKKCFNKVFVDGIIIDEIEKQIEDDNYIRSILDPEDKGRSWEEIKEYTREHIRNNIKIARTIINCKPINSKRKNEIYESAVLQGSDVFIIPVSKIKDYGRRRTEIIAEETEIDLEHLYLGWALLYGSISPDLFTCPLLERHHFPQQRQSSEKKKDMPIYKERLWNFFSRALEHSIKFTQETVDRKKQYEFVCALYNFGVFTHYYLDALIRRTEYDSGENESNHSKIDVALYQTIRAVCESPAQVVENSINVNIDFRLFNGTNDVNVIKENIEEYVTARIDDSASLFRSCELRSKAPYTDKASVILAMQYLCEIGCIIFYSLNRDWKQNQDSEEQQKNIIFKVIDGIKKRFFEKIPPQLFPVWAIESTLPDDLTFHCLTQRNSKKPKSPPIDSRLVTKPLSLPSGSPSPNSRKWSKADEVVLRKEDGSINWEAFHDNSIWVAILDSVPPNEDSLRERSFPKYYDVSQKIGLEKMLADERFLQEFNGAHAYNWPDQMHFRGRSHLQLGLFLEACGEPETADYCYNAYRKSDPGCRRFAVYRDEIE